MADNRRVAIIIGAGPAGLTAAYELLVRTDIKPVILEAKEFVGGLSRTVEFQDNKFDLGGHRFFTKSERVLRWWFSFLPLESTGEDSVEIAYDEHLYKLFVESGGVNSAKVDEVMLIRDRKSRFYFDGDFYDYPPVPSFSVFQKLGLRRTIRIVLSYAKSVLFPISREDSLEQLWINRFGRELAGIFFIPYGEKVWGMPASEISVEWGNQRIKNMSLRAVVSDHLLKTFPFLRRLTNRPKATSLIERFLYPKYGSGQLWELVADDIRERGGEIRLGSDVTHVEVSDAEVKSVVVKDHASGEFHEISGDFYFSTVPVKHLVSFMGDSVPNDVKAIALGLKYRDMIIVGLEVSDLKAKDDGGDVVTDNWIYIQDPNIEMGRLEIFNNWSPYMSSQLDHFVLGAEYFCDEGDAIWKMSDEELIALAADELDRLELLDSELVVCGVVERVKKAYPAYYGTYDRFDVVRNHVNGLENLFLIGRNGMHKYNNQDHSMLTAMVAVDRVVDGDTDRSSIWGVNTSDEYIEEKSS